MVLAAWKSHWYVASLVPSPESVALVAAEGDDVGGPMVVPCPHGALLNSCALAASLAPFPLVVFPFPWLLLVVVPPSPLVVPPFHLVVIKNQI